MYHAQSFLHRRSTCLSLRLEACSTVYPCCQQLCSPSRSESNKVWINFDGIRGGNGCVHPLRPGFSSGYPSVSSSTFPGRWRIELGKFTKIAFSWALPVISAFTADDPEKAHELAVFMLGSGIAPKDGGTDDERLALEVILSPCQRSLHPAHQAL